MGSHISALFRERREKLELSMKQAAELAGYGNFAHGMHRCRDLEDPETYFPKREVLMRFADALDIPLADVDAALCADFEELDRPTSMRLIVRIMPAVYSTRALPPDCTRKEAEAIAAHTARAEGRPCCLVLSKIRGVSFEADGRRSECYGLPTSSMPRGLNMPGAGGDRLRVQQDVARTRREAAPEVDDDAK